MRGMKYAVVMLLLAQSALWGQTASKTGTTVTLQNQEDSAFYYVMDPPELGGITASNQLLESEVTRYLATESSEFPFVTLEPKSSQTIDGLAEGTHLLIGFFAIMDKTEFPVRIVSVQVDKKLGSRVYELYSEPAFLNPARGMGRLAPFGATPSLVSIPSTKSATTASAEGNAVQPAESSGGAAASTATTATATNATVAAVPVVISQIAQFQLNYTPAIFTRELDSGFTVLPIEDSGYWNRNGTRIASISGGISSTTIELELKSASGFSTNVSYFLYLFPSRILGQDNQFTVEIIPVIQGQQGGVALLWEKGKTEPFFFGTLWVEGPILRVTADLSSMPEDLRSFSVPGSSADVTSCYFDESTKTYEEYFYTTFALSTLSPVTH
jgi:hypothetical protein